MHPTWQNSLQTIKIVSTDITHIGGEGVIILFIQWVTKAMDKGNVIKYGGSVRKHAATEEQISDENAT